ncbi:MAG: VWA domain-containing protein, partial [Bryobacteraceae bacterium]
MRIACGVVLLLTMARAGAAQGAIKVDVDVVNVLCTVYDKQGALIKDLTKDDFRIREDGRQQQIRYFARETDLPLTVALLVDMSGSVSQFIRAEKGTAAQFFHDVLRPEDHALLIGFSSTIVLWQNFTASVQELSAALARMHGVAFHGLPPLGQPMPSTLLYGAVYSTAGDKLKTVPGRKAMVIISDGLDNGSPVQLEQAVRAVQTTNTVVFGICYENSRVPGCSYLKSLSEPTGGRMFRVDAKTSLAKIFQTIEEELRSQYSLGYVSTNPARDGKFRKLRVEMRGKGLKVEMRGKGLKVE